MTEQQRTFSPEFKQQAVSLVLDQGYSALEASRSVGIGDTVLRRWVHQLQTERQGITPQGKAITPVTAAQRSGSRPSLMPHSPRTGASR